MRKPSRMDVRMFLVASLIVLLLGVSPGIPPAAWGGQPGLGQEEATPDTTLQKDAYPGPGAPEPGPRRPIRQFFDNVKVSLQDTDSTFKESVNYVASARTALT